MSANETDFSSTHLNSSLSLPIYYWSDPLNWSNGLPSDGDTVTIVANQAGTVPAAATDVMNLPISTLSALTFNVQPTGYGYYEFVTFNSNNSSSFTIGSLIADSPLDLGVYAEGQQSITVTIASISGLTASGFGKAGVIGASGSGATLLDESAANLPDLTYVAADGATVILDAAPALGSDLAYNATSNATGTIAINADPGFYQAVLDEVVPGCVIELPGTSVTAVDLGSSQHELTITTDRGAYQFAEVRYFESVTGYTAAFDPNTGLEAITFTNAPPCFVAGTRILTQDGERPVETLRVGDMAILANGTATPIVWIGRRHVKALGDADNRTLRPVCIAAGAFGPGLPKRDLLVSPDHALFLDGCLVPAQYLVNGTTVTRAPADAITYFHIELPAHGILLADGLPAESYLDTGNRDSFANAAFAAPRAEGDRTPQPCAPLVIGGTMLAAIRALASGEHLRQAA